jgi:RHS repeat-associated protein
VVVVGDPVDVVTGANLDGQTDFTLAGPLPLAWSRWYNSSNNWTPGGLGWGHTHEYERRLVLDLDGFRYLGPTSGAVGFPPLERDGDSFANKGYLLRRVTRRRYTLSQTGQPHAVYEYVDGRSHAFLSALIRGPARVEFKYDKDDLLHTIIDSRGRPIRVEHAAGRVSRLSMPGQAGRTKLLAAYEYDAIGNLVRVTDPYGNLMRYQFDEEHRQLRKTDRRGYGFRFAYDTAGRCTLAGGEDRTDEVRLEYDTAQRVTLVTRADGGQWLYFYDASGVVTKIIAPSGGTQQFVKDETGRVSAELDPLGNVTRRAFDSAGGVIGRIDPLGIFRDENDTGSGPRTHRVPANPIEWELGKLLDSGFANGLRVSVPPSREEDDFGLLFRETFSDGTSRRWLYDQNGNELYTDREGRVTSSEYNSWNMLAAITDPNGSKECYEYATNRCSAAVTDAGGTRSEYRYDLQDRLIEVRRHGVVRETYQRDVAGNIICKKDSAGNELLRFEIGRRNLPAVCRLASGETHKFAHDEHGRCVLAETDTFVVAFAYDVAGRRTADQRDGFGVEHQFGIDVAAETIIFGCFSVKYYWLADDELEITDPTGGRHTIRFHGSRVVERRLGNGTREVSQYGETNRCLSRQTQRTGAPGVWSRKYRYSPEGDLLGTEDLARGVMRYRYDAAHRLVGMQQGESPEEAIELDAAGNILRMPGLRGVSLRDGNRLAAANGEQFEYNHRNNISTRTGSAGTTRYHYDSRDMLVRIERTGQSDWTAAYDPLGRRVWKAWGTRKVEYYWDTDRLIAERDESGRVRVYVYADTFAMVPLMFVDYSTMDTAPNEGTRYNVFTDQIGTPLLVEDSAGKEVWSAQVDPYGHATIDLNSTIECALRFPGHYFDAETRLHYNRFRYYDPVLGRYLQSDPAGLLGGVNLYGYPAAPLTRVDVRGLHEGEGECGGPHGSGNQPAPADGHPPAEAARPVKKGSEDPEGRKTPQELQDAADQIHGEIKDPKARANRTTCVTQSRDEDGNIVHTVTSSTGQLTAEQKAKANELFPGTANIVDDPAPHAPTKPKEPTPPEPTGDPKKDARAQARYDKASAAYPDKMDDYNAAKAANDQALADRKVNNQNHAEQSGIAATDDHDLDKPREQASSSGAGHGGSACPPCAAAQQQAGVDNVTGNQTADGGNGRTDGGPPRDQWAQQDAARNAAKQQAAAQQQPGGGTQSGGDGS